MLHSSMFLVIYRYFSPIVGRVNCSYIPTTVYTLIFSQQPAPGKGTDEVLNYSFDCKDIVCLIISTITGIWYILKKVGPPKLPPVARLVTLVCF